MRPKLSVIIPMYNEERYIQRCLNSLLGQTQKIYELILVDDGSTDRTVKYANRFKDDFESFTMLRRKHKGPGEARNLGAKKAKGNILILVDADMMFDKNYLKYLIKPIIEGREFGTTHGSEKVANLENKWARSWSIDRIPNPPKRTAVFRAIKKDIFLEKGGFDISKGYFDDDLSHIGSGLVVRKAICYHNNPETITEAFKHSMWVGGSIYKTGTFLYYLKRLLPFFILLGITIMSAILIMRNNFTALIVISFIVSFVILYSRVLIQAITEKYISHLIYLPIMWIVRFSGYGYGFLKERVKNQ